MSGGEGREGEAGLALVDGIAGGCGDVGMLGGCLSHELGRASSDSLLSLLPPYISPSGFPHLRCGITIKIH